MQKYAAENGGAALAGGWSHDALQQGKLIAPGQ
jgi:NADH dehydrogenase (ubiquinone) flavoprotein 1